MEVVQTGKSHFVSALCRQSLDCGKREKNLILLSWARNCRKQKRQIWWFAYKQFFSSQSAALCYLGWCSEFSSASQKKVLVFLFKQIVHEKHKGQTLQPNFSNVQANKIRLGVLILDGKQARHVWNYFHTVNTCFHAHTPGQQPADANGHSNRQKPKVWAPDAKRWQFCSLSVPPQGWQIESFFSVWPHNSSCLETS